MLRLFKKSELLQSTAFSHIFWPKKFYGSLLLYSFDDRLGGFQFLKNK